jgi:hypothetical protein
MIWLLLIPALLIVAVALTWLAHRDLNRPEPKPEPCTHPWYIDGRCMVCGTPKG